MSFVDRHIGADSAQERHMLDVLGYTTLEDLVDALVPGSIRDRTPLDLPAGLDEEAVLERLRAIADENEVFTSLIGMGYADTVTPPVVARNVLESPAWYTAYTPYQPEISQGRLEALLNFQTMVSDLTAMDLANASLLDEATAAAEGLALCARVNDGNVFVVDPECHPQTIDVVATRAEPLGFELVVADPASVELDDVAAVLVQYPGTSGALVDLGPMIERAHAGGALVVVAADLLALTLVQPPGEAGADVVVGSSQRFGVPLGCGGPHAAFFATRDEYKRSMPGRLVGLSVDAAGRPALRLALQTREQHIRRERATSNICTAQVLLAVIAGFYAVYHGPDGLRGIATRVHDHARRLAARLRNGGVDVTTEAYFDTITVSVPGRAHELAATARSRRINLRIVDADRLGISLDETTTDAVVDTVAEVLVGGASGTSGAVPEVIPADLRRTSAYLAHPVFGRYHSETAMLRYLRELADKDLALDRTMIPLGSCTMKLNATTEMIPITWPQFARIHPFAPDDQLRGYRRLVGELEEALAEITGYDAVSLQPNAGSQGEFAGLLTIRAYHRSRGEGERDVCLIPASAHGTNAASATMAGLRVVVVACDDDGNVDLDDLEHRAEEHAARLAALMVTYPSTHGVFEAHITDICELVHHYGGQVYLDGANLNALVGVARPGGFGADVSHLNLHKTFCIPHGGGGPGVGPVAVRRHLAEFLPEHVAAAPWGSAGILPISWTYLALLGPEGLTRATGFALLTANYVAHRLSTAYPVLYAGRAGLVAHECIIDLRELTARTGVTVEDVAKRLIDFGFHAPTMSFPVAGTLMIEPTESEDLGELDRFCAAMLAIRAEIEALERGEWPIEQSPLRGSPHPAADLVGDTWERPYAREAAAYPVASLRGHKYWVPVSRIDNAYGDRNVVCACPPVSAYAGAPEVASDRPSEVT